MKILKNLPSLPDLGANKFGLVITGIVDYESNSTMVVYPRPTKGEVRWSGEKTGH